VPGTEGHFLELVTRFEADGMGWLAAVGAAEGEFEARGWEIPT
jgi:hypothetical protein